MEPSAPWRLSPGTSKFRPRMILLLGLQSSLVFFGAKMVQPSQRARTTNFYACHYKLVARWLPLTELFKINVPTASALKRALSCANYVPLVNFTIKTVNYVKTVLQALIEVQWKLTTAVINVQKVWHQLRELLASKHASNANKVYLWRMDHAFLTVVQDLGQIQTQSVNLARMVTNPAVPLHVLPAQTVKQHH